jgi:hypothetical protein
VKVYLYASSLGFRYAECLMSLHGKVEYVLHCEDQRDWHWDKLVAYQHKVASENPGEVIVFADLWDSLFVGDPEELELQLRAGGECYVQASKSNWPSVGRDDEIPDKGPWRYVNGSFVAGVGDWIAKATAYGMDNWPIRPKDPRYPIHQYPENDNNGRMWANVYLDGRCNIDSNCIIAQQLNNLKEGELHYDTKQKRFVNTVTGSRPHFLHASQGTWQTIPPQVIKEKTGR